MSPRKCLLFILFFTSVAFAEPPKELDIFLLVGQSNMAGRGKLLEEDQAAIPGVFLLNAKQEWEAAVPPFNRYAKQKKKIYTGMNPGVGFVRHWKSEHPVGIVCQARGGTSIGQWLAEGSALYASAISEAKVAAESGRIVGILWHQGESDSGRVAAYPEQLKTLVERFRNDLGDASLPIVFGQLGPWNEKYAAFNEMIVEQAKGISGTACVTTEGLKGKDNAHFDRASQLELGKRYAEALRSLISQRGP